MAVDTESEMAAEAALQIDDTEAEMAVAEIEEIVESKPYRRR